MDGTHPWAHTFTADLDEANVASKCCLLAKVECPCNSLIGHNRIGVHKEYSKVGFLTCRRFD